MRVQESLVEPWINSGLLKGQGYWIQPSWEPRAYWHKSFCRRWRKQPPSSTENWIKDLLSLALPIRARFRFPHSLSIPSGSFHKLLILNHQRADKWKHNYRKLTKLITWFSALPNSMKLWAMPCRATQDGWVMVESTDETWSTGEGNG